MADAAQLRAVRKSATAYRTISEVSDELGVPQHVLRFWETKFNQIRPLKRGGGRRYYRPEDVTLLRSIQHLLYEDGFTIKGVQKLLRDGGVQDGGVVTIATRAEPDAPDRVTDTGAPSPMPAADARPVAGDAVSEPALPDITRQELESILTELKEIRALLKPT